MVVIKSPQGVGPFNGQKVSRSFNACVLSYLYIQISTRVIIYGSKVSSNRVESNSALLAAGEHNLVSRDGETGDGRGHDPVQRVTYEDV